MNELMIILFVKINTKYRIFFFIEYLKMNFMDYIIFWLINITVFKNIFRLFLHILSIDNIKFVSHYKLFNFI